MGRLEYLFSDVFSDSVRQNELVKRGFIYKGKHSGWYSISDECFYTDGQVTSRIDPSSEKEIRVSIETGNIVEWSEETNYKFVMSSFRTKLLDYYLKNLHGTFFPNR